MPDPVIMQQQIQDLIVRVQQLENAVGKTGKLIMDATKEMNK